jgi:hypothetical protein
MLKFFTKDDYNKGSTEPWDEKYKGPIYILILDTYEFIFFFAM